MNPQTPILDTEGTEAGGAKAEGTEQKPVRMEAEPAITLEVLHTWFPVENQGDAPDVSVTYERKAWKCTLCGRWEEFVVLSYKQRSHIVKGCGGASHHYNGGRIDHCMNCCSKADRLLGVPL
jgi:hypothetical protein